MSVIVTIGTAVPANKYSQEELCEYMGALSGNDDLQRKKLKMLYAKSAINSRHSVLSDFGAPNNPVGFFAGNSSDLQIPSIDERLDTYQQYAPQLAIQAINQCDFTKVSLDKVTHLITVSCTGMSAPGLEISIINELQLRKNIKRTSINFMGCYAALHGLQQAHYICSAETHATVLVVCVELCTLHFQHDLTPDNMMANCLFADGAAAVLVTTDQIAQRRNVSGLKLENFYSQIIADGYNDMAWKISAKGFLMTLSAYIPNLIALNLDDFLDDMLCEYSIEKDQISNWAIHPGGRKILDVLAKGLQLEKSDLGHSYDVLSRYGNMSSPTILFVLKEIMSAQQPDTNGQHIFALAFGPGLVVESCLLKYV